MPSKDIARLKKIGQGQSFGKCQNTWDHLENPLKTTTNTLQKPLPPKNVEKNTETKKHLRTPLLTKDQTLKNQEQKPPGTTEINLTNEDPHPRKEAHEIFISSTKYFCSSRVKPRGEASGGDFCRCAAFFVPKRRGKQGVKKKKTL